MSDNINENVDIDTVADDNVNTEEGSDVVVDNDVNVDVDINTDNKEEENISQNYITHARLKLKDSKEYSEAIPIRPGANNVTYKKTNTVDKALDDLYTKYDASRVIINGDEYIKRVNGVGHNTSFTGEINFGKSGFVYNEADNSLTGKYTTGETSILPKFRIADRFTKVSGPETTRFGEFYGDQLYLSIDRTNSFKEGTATEWQRDYAVAIGKNGHIQFRNYDVSVDRTGEVSTAQGKDLYYGGNPAPLLSFVSDTVLGQSGIHLADPANPSSPKTENYDIPLFCHNRTNLWVGGIDSERAPWTSLKNDNTALHLVTGTKIVTAENLSEAANDEEAPFYINDMYSKQKFNELVESTSNRLGKNNFLIGDPDGIKIKIPKAMILTQNGLCHGRTTYKNTLSANEKDFYSTETLIHTGNIYNHMPASIFVKCPADSESGLIDNIISCSWEVKKEEDENPNYGTLTGIGYITVPESGYYAIEVSSTIACDHNSTPCDIKYRCAVIEKDITTITNTTTIKASLGETNKELNAKHATERISYVTHANLYQNQIVFFQARPRFPVSVGETIHISYEGTTIGITRLGPARNNISVKCKPYNMAYAHTQDSVINPNMSVTMPKYN